MTESESFCLMCGKRTNDHDRAEDEDCGEAWSRVIPMLRGEGYGT